MRDYSDLFVQQLNVFKVVKILNTGNCLCRGSQRNFLKPIRVIKVSGEMGGVSIRFIYMFEAQTKRLCTSSVQGIERRTLN